MASQNIARLGVVLGLDTAEFTASIDKAISENAKLKNAIRRDTNAAAGELINLKNATDDYGKTLTKVQMMERETTSGRFMNATKEMKAQLLEKAKAYDAVANAAKNVTAAEFKMNAQQKMGLTYQTTDLVTSLAAGQNPMIVLLQQGGQLKDQMGGLGNMFKALGTLITPFSVGMTAAAAAVGGLGLAMYQAHEEMKKFRNDMALTGQFAGIAYDQFIKMGDSLSHMANVSIGQTRDALAALVGSGQFTRQSLDSVSQAVLQFGKLSGLSASEAANKLIPSLNGTASSARKLNDTYHFLSLEQYKQIELLEKQGKEQEAIRLTADLLSQSFAKTTRDLGTLETAWKNITHWASSAWDAMLGFGRESGIDRAIVLQEKINKLANWLEVRSRDFPNADLSSQRKMLEAMKAELAGITERVGSEMDKADRASRIAEEEAKKIKDRAGAGGIDKEKQITTAIEKLKADIKYTTSLASLNEIQRIEAESEKEKADKRTEFAAKSAEEKRAMGSLLATQLAQEEILIEVKKNEKIRLVRQKEMMYRHQFEMDQKKTFDDEMTAEYLLQESIKQQIRDKTKSLEIDKQDLMLKNQMIYATEKEVQLAQISLKYQREREKPFANIEALKQQETLERFNVELQDSMKKTSQVFDSVWSNMSSAIDNFVRTGKLSMKDFARSVIQDLIAIEMKAMALSFLRMMFAPTMGPSIDGGGPLPSSFNQYLTPRASGGPVSGNTPYLVGEKGPELFMPSGSGTIIPNSQTSQMGNVTNVTNNYINAIDTKSFEDRLLGSSTAIWAANKYGEKNLATNYGRT
jgi:lambda family phage tail tape measure protein